MAATSQAVPLPSRVAARATNKQLRAGLRCLAASETVFFPLPMHTAGADWRKRVCHAAFREFGKGNFATEWRSEGGSPGVRVWRT